MKLKKNYIEKLGENSLINLAEFIVKENFKHHSDSLPENYMDDVIEIYEEEKKFYGRSSIFVSKDVDGSILGVIRVLKWNYADQLPIEKIFGINPIFIAGNAPVKSIWHIGRFAIRKSVRDIKLLKKLLVCAIADICKDESAIAFAEIDAKLLRILTLIGIQATVVGESVEYLGSETIPVCFTHQGLITFYNANKHMIAEDLNTCNPERETNLLKSVVPFRENNNYPLA